DGGGGSNGGGGSWGGGIGGGGLGGQYYGPLIGRGADRLYPPRVLNDFDLDRAISADGNDRRKMNASLRKALFATELAAGITTWTYAKADALARAGGFSLNEVFPLVYKGLRRVGYASAVYGAIEAIIVVVDGGELTNEEMIILG